MKSKILRMLKERQTYVSGEELSAQLGVTRAAVWKAIGKLREEGYEIDSATNRGYRLVSCPRDRMTRENLLDAATYDGSMWKEIYYAKQLDSTNLEAKRVLLEGRGAEPGAVVCEQQFSGRGRRGRGWVSPLGAGLWMTLVLRPNLEPMKASMLTLVAGLAVSRAVEELYEIPATIKWPNDIVVHGKKLCGILTEMTTEEMRMTGIVVGIGVNTGITDFGEELREKATSLALEVAKPDEVDRLMVFRAVLRQFQSCYEQFMQTKDLSLLIDDYNARCITVGHRVRVEEGASAFEAWAQAVDAQGELLVRLEDGTSRTVCAGEVSVRGVMGYV